MSDPFKTTPPEAFDSWSEAQMKDPFPMYAELRSRCPVAHSQRHGGFAFVSNYEGAKRVLTDFSNFSSANGVVLPPRAAKVLPIDLDPPEHTKYRRIINPHFSAEAVEKVKPNIVRVVNDLIDTFVEDGKIDLANHLVRPALPPIVMPMIGAPVEDFPKVRDWHMSILRERVANPQRVVEATEGFIGYLRALVARRRLSAPQEDALGSLLLANIDGKSLTDENIASTLFALLLAGLDTTASTTLEILLYLARNPESVRRLTAGEVPWATAIEEFMRAFVPATVIMRTVARDIELEGVALRKGEFIQVLPGAANRDPAQFAEPERCILDRADNPHLGFGAGAHVCIGRFLAKAEIEIIVKAILKRLPDFKVAEDFEPEYWCSNTRAMKALPVTFTAGSKRDRSDDLGFAA